MIAVSVSVQVAGNAAAGFTPVEATLGRSPGWRSAYRTAVSASLGETRRPVSRALAGPLAGKKIAETQ